MELRFIKASPCSNTTVFVLDDVPTERYGKIASEIMDYDHLCAEQLGYIVKAKNKKAVLQLNMSGNEFCGNALLSAAAFSIHKGYTKKEIFYLESSGTDELLECRVLKKSNGKYWAKVQMPSNYAIDAITTIKVGDKEYSGRLVNLPGISHFVFEGIIANDVYEKIANELIKTKETEAYGIIPYQRISDTKFSIVPYVYVPEADSRVFEKACGSGSYSLGLTLKQKEESTITILQPGGEIDVTIGKKNYIAGEVYFSCEGVVFVNSQIN